MPVWKNKSFRRAAAALFLIILVVGVATFLPVREWLSLFVEWVRAHGAIGIATFMAVYICGSVLLMPSAWFTVASAIAFGFWRGLLIAATSASIAAAISFLIARYFARESVKKWLAKNKRLHALDGVVTEGDWKIVLLCRLTPIIPFVLSNYFFGLTRLRFWPYALASTVGIFPGAMLYAYIGYLSSIALNGESRQRTPQEYASMVLGLVMTIALVIYVSRRARNALQQKQQSAAA